MKTITKNTLQLTITLAALSCAALAQASECKLPKGCEYLDSEFSTGGGDKVSYIMEVTCKMPEGKITKFTSWQISAGSLFGIGRFTAPKQIDFVKSNESELKCIF